MSAETNNDEFRANILAEIKKIQEELNELKNMKLNIVKKSTKTKQVEKTSAKIKTVKRKPVKRATKSKKRKIGKTGSK